MCVVIKMILGRIITVMGVNDSSKKRQKSDQKLRQILLKIIDFAKSWEVTGIKLSFPWGFIVSLTRKKKSKHAGVY